MAGDGTGRDELVHDPTGQPDDLVLDLLAETGDGDRRPPQAGAVEQTRDRGDFERGRRREAGTGGNVSVDSGPPTTAGHPTAGEQPDHAREVPSPRHHRARIGGRIDHHLAETHRHNLDCPRRLVAVVAHRDRGIERQRHRQGEPVVVVGVLTDQVDPARRPNHPVGRSPSVPVGRNDTLDCGRLGHPHNVQPPSNLGDGMVAVIGMPSGLDEHTGKIAITIPEGRA